MHFFRWVRIALYDNFGFTLTMAGIAVGAIGAMIGIGILFLSTLFLIFSGFLWVIFILLPLMNMDSMMNIAVIIFLCPAMVFGFVAVETKTHELLDWTEKKFRVLIDKTVREVKESTK